MTKLKLYPYRIDSESAIDLAELLEIKRLKVDSETYMPQYGQVVVNWGNSQFPTWWRRAQQRGVRMLNMPENVGFASNKLTCLKMLLNAGVRTPHFTTQQSIAEAWLRAGETVVERHELRGNSGAGIRIVNPHDPDMAANITFAPLYTKFIPKTNEFRVHVFRGGVIDYIEKKKVSSERRPYNFNPYVSSTSVGWVFTRGDVRDIPEVREIALKAVSTLGLDFGAVDIVFFDGLPYVLEVNTAPGLSGTTLVKYANALRRHMGVSDLPAHRSSHLLDQNIVSEPISVRPIAAQAAQVNRPDGDMVTLTIDRATARKLMSLLSSVC